MPLRLLGHILLAALWLLLLRPAAAAEAECEVTVFGEDGGMVQVDGKMSGVLPLPGPLQLLPGTHRVRLSKGRRHVETQVTLLPRRQAEIRFTLSPEVAMVSLTPGAVLLLRTKGAGATLQGRTEMAVREAARSGRLSVIPKEEQEAILSHTPHLQRCLDRTECQEELARKADALFVLDLQIDREPDPTGVQREGDQGSFHLGGRLHDVTVGMVSAAATQECAACGEEQVLSATGGMVHRLLQQGLLRTRGTLQVRSTPPGAQVLLDGRLLGTTPYQRDAFAGAHTVTVRRDGYRPFAGSATVEDDRTAQLSVQLERIVRPRPPGRSLRLAKWVLGGAGLMALLAGATLWGLDGYQNCSKADRHHCPLELDGRTPGITLLSIGGAALLSSAVLFGVDARRSGDGARVALVTASGRF